MDLRLYPAPLRGAVTPPPSKSLLHRQLICLAQAGSSPAPGPRRRRSGHGPGPVGPVSPAGAGHRLRASGSTLWFLLPLAMARGRVGTRFAGTRRLLARPLPGDWGLAPTENGLRVTRPFPRAASRWTEAGPPS